MALHCYICGRFVGKDGHPDIIDGEIGYPQCGRCWREHRGVHMRSDDCERVHPES